MPRLVWIDRPAVFRLKVLFALLAGSVALGWWFCIRMPGESWHGAPPPLSAAERQLAADLRADLKILAGDIGERHVFEGHHLRQAADFLAARLAQAGYDPTRHGYEAVGERVDNLQAEHRGALRPEEIVVVGAHYDSVSECAGANDNGSGVVATLALAREFAHRHSARTLRFVLFANEEPPFFWTEQQGSLVYARACRRRDERIVGMLCLESMGCFSTRRGSQHYPTGVLKAFYPDRGDFIGFIGNLASRHLVRRAVGTFRGAARFPSEGMVGTALIPGVGWSDHWSFWQAGYPAVMVTDTAPFRYPHYHTAHDTIDQIDYDSLARVVAGLRAVVADWAG